MPYRNVSVTFHSPKPSPENPSLMAVATLKAELWIDWDGQEKLYQQLEWELLKTKSGEEYNPSWWNLAREFRALPGKPGQPKKIRRKPHKK